MSSFRDDTIGDKILRFCIGVVLEATAGFYFFAPGTPASSDTAYIKTISTSALGVGLLGVVFGRSFLERFVNRQRWRW